MGKPGDSGGIIVSPKGELMGIESAGMDILILLGIK